MSANPLCAVNYVSTVTASQGLFLIASEHVPSRWRAVSCGAPCSFSRVGKTLLSFLCDVSGEFWRVCTTGVALLSLHNVQELMNLGDGVHLASLMIFRFFGLGVA